MPKKEKPVKDASNNDGSTDKKHCLDILQVVPPKDLRPPVKPIHPNLPNIYKGVVAIICGPIRAGKSSILANWLNNPNFYEGCFEDSQVCIISSTIANCATSRFSYKRYGGHEMYKDEIIENLILKQKARKKAKLQTGYALVLDDLSGELDPKGRKGGAILRFITRMRHYVNLGDPALVVVSNQKYNQIGTVIRCNATDVLLSGHIKSKKEYETIKEDLADSIGGSAKFDEMFARAQEKPFSWLYIRLSSTPCEVYLNFKERLY